MKQKIARSGIIVDPGSAPISSEEPHQDRLWIWGNYQLGIISIEFSDECHERYAHHTRAAEAADRRAEVRVDLI